MTVFESEISRISKLAIDLEGADPAEVLARRQAYTVVLSCGDDVASSYTLQLAALTAATIGARCFPGAIRAIISDKLAATPFRVWPWLGDTFGQMIARVIGPDANMAAPPSNSRVLVFGNAPEVKGAQRVTFDGWVAKVGPVDRISRLAERQYFSASGILAASLALSELFLSFAGLNLEATRRAVALSLWRPDLSVEHPDALGILAEYLPTSCWLLGLGHLGNAYLWTLATLPYAKPQEAAFALFDFDRVVKDNVETGVLFEEDFIDKFKAHACDTWLKRRHFERVRLVERRFDSTFRLQDDEPALALCGFDTNPARRDLPGARFSRVIESGLGGTANNFDTISFHTLPNPRSPEEMWPDQTKDELAKIEAEQERVAQDNQGYQNLAPDICGRRDLAGKSVAVPFVGAVAASLVVAEAVRLLHDGPSYHRLKLSLGSPDRIHAIPNGNYGAEDAAGIAAVDCNRRWMVA